MSPTVGKSSRALSPPPAGPVPRVIGSAAPPGKTGLLTALPAPAPPSRTQVPLPSAPWGTPQLTAPPDVPRPPTPLRGGALRSRAGGFPDLLSSQGKQTKARTRGSRFWGLVIYRHRCDSAQRPRPAADPPRPGSRGGAALPRSALSSPASQDGPDPAGTPSACRGAAGPALTAKSGLDGLWSQPGSGGAWTCGLGFRLGPAEFPLFPCHAGIWAFVLQEQRGRPGMTLVLGDTGLRVKDLRRRLADTRRTSA